MAYYKVRIEVWCDWNPVDSDLDDIAQGVGVGEAICDAFSYRRGKTLSNRYSQTSGPRRRED